MKKLIIVLFLVACAAQTTRAALTRSEVAPNPDHPDQKNTIWSRNGIEIMTYAPLQPSGSSLCVITPFKLRSGRAALVIWFTDKKISSITSGPALDGYPFSIDDLNQDGVPDLIQIKEKATSKVIEAYSIIDGVVEPLPDDQFKKDREEFSPGDAIVDYLKKKTK